MKEKLWTKDFISVTTISFFIFLAFYILMTALPLYLVGQLHAGADKVGLVLTLFLLAAIVIRPSAGKWVSRGSQKRIFIYSTIAFFVGTLLYPFATNIWALLLLRIFHGFTFGIITTVKGTISAELIPASRRGEGLSFFSLAMGLAMVFGPLIGLNLSLMHAYNLLFVLCMIISAINIVLSFVTKVPEQDVKAHGKKHKFSFNDIVDKKAAKFAIPTFFLAFAYSGISSFLPLFAQQINLVAAASTFFAIYAVFMLICRPFTGRWSDRFGAKVIIYPSIVLYLIGMFMINSTHTAAIMIIAGAIIGIGYGSITPIFQTQIISSV
ncbi:MFS transporter [Bacillus sp. EB600]|uniref:MFS transporter n=1 Tax=Bacillus sp. EB600 TaxID=2806345 RepID=UPI00210D1B1F|nr:MFS transporter [Bacillus sp. EB600]MCQ6279371.1 MFS transporter [Bacillus sp. EB600]